MDANPPSQQQMTFQIKAAGGTNRLNQAHFPNAAPPPLAPTCITSPSLFTNMCDRVSSIVAHKANMAYRTAASRKAGEQVNK